MEQTVKAIVIGDFRTAAVFERVGIDFCCGGNVSIETACAERGLDAAAVREELLRATASLSDAAERFEEWDLDLLADHIVATHHLYVRTALPSLLAHTAKVARVHGERHPEVIEIDHLFQQVSAELSSHMRKEELLLFPAIRTLVAAVRAGSPAPRPPFGSVANPIGVMEAEHASAGGALERIRRLTGGYRPPEDACTTYRVTYQELEEFERDLHIHVHKENNILFPAAIAMEEGRLFAAPQRPARTAMSHTSGTPS
jgi:regulator of cell morphogenesis and NO signaling